MKIYNTKETIDIVNKKMQEIAEIVGSTLGPLGTSVNLVLGRGDVTLTKDGLTVLSALVPEYVSKHRTPEETLSDKAIAQLLNAVVTQEERTGDGTTSAVVFTASMCAHIYNTIRKERNITEGVPDEGYPHIMENLISENEIRNLISFIEETINGLSRPLTKGQLEQIALVSSNGDVVISKLIADIFDENQHAVIDISVKKLETHSVERADGFLLKSGPLTMSGEDISGNFFLGVVKDEIDDDMLPEIIMNLTEGATTLLILENAGFDRHALIEMSSRISKSTKSNVLFVPAPDYGDRKVNTIKDIVSYLGLIPFSQVGENKGTLCLCNGVYNSSRVIFEGVDNKDVAEITRESRKTYLFKALENKDLQYREKTVIRRSIANLDGAYYVFKVGGLNYQDRAYHATRIEDTIKAVRRAIEFGIVPGGGAAYAEIAQRATNSDVLSDKAKGLINSAVQDYLQALYNDTSIGANYITEYKYPIMPAVFCKGGYTNTLEDGIIEPSNVPLEVLKVALSQVMWLTSSSYTVVY